eukprot:CAMPEP_0185196816 /NCGR_PEP_ID=MMETSP1140-20130426/38648_1 /TAXON_ID=298111 /ORGANISM="Pavlova sp., Strain CCMP459" /LENGTH=155 /DNA_ID=CAMNT_0027763883 /DNA_START=53 /DNA_END=517 /DNA_ORIENTATION=-
MPRPRAPRPRTATEEADESKQAPRPAPCAPLTAEARALAAASASAWPVGGPWWDAPPRADAVARGAVAASGCHCCCSSGWPEAAPCVLCLPLRLEEGPLASMPPAACDCCCSLPPPLRADAAGPWLAALPAETPPSPPRPPRRVRVRGPPPSAPA